MRRSRAITVHVGHAMRAGIGQFAGAVDPNDPTHAVVAELQDSMTGDPGIRLAGQMAARGRRYTGTALSPQRFVHFSDEVNSQAALEVNRHAPLKRNRSRALGQMRGLPGM